MLQIRNRQNNIEQANNDYLQTWYNENEELNSLYKTIKGLFNDYYVTEQKFQLNAEYDNRGEKFTLDCDETILQNGMNKASDLAESIVYAVLKNNNLDPIKYPFGAMNPPDLQVGNIPVEVKSAFCSDIKNGSCYCSYNNAVKNNDAIANDLCDSESLLRKTICVTLYYYIDVKTQELVFFGSDVCMLALMVRFEDKGFTSEEHNHVPTTLAHKSNSNFNTCIGLYNYSHYRNSSAFDILHAYVTHVGIWTTEEIEKYKKDEHRKEREIQRLVRQQKLEQKRKEREIQKLLREKTREQKMLEKLERKRLREEARMIRAQEKIEKQRQRELKRQNKIKK